MPSQTPESNVHPRRPQLVPRAELFPWLAVARPAPSVLALTYHSVTEVWGDQLAIHPDVFAEHMRALARRGYRGVTISEAATVSPRARDKVVAITFDDAFATVVNACDVLAQLGWPATVFVPTVAVDIGVPMRWLLAERYVEADDGHLLPLSWDALAELRVAGWEIGSHSRTHPMLSALGDREIEAELGGSREEICQHFGECRSISYPFGELDARVIRHARAAGYSCGTGLVGGALRQPMAIPRFAVSGSDGPLKFALKTSGAVWQLRETPAWNVVDRVRGRHRSVWHRRTMRGIRTALILDGDAGSSVAVTRSLGRAGWIVITPSGSRSALSRYTTSCVELPSAVLEPADFATALAEVVEQRDIDLVVPSTDASLEAAWSTVGLDGPHILGGDRATVQVSLDRFKCLTAAQRAGFPVPRWGAPSSKEEALEMFADFGVPCVVKPRRSFGPATGALAHRRHSLVDSPQEVKSALLRLREPGGELPLMQEYIPGRSLSVSAVINDGAVIGCVARETFTFHPIAGGTSVWQQTVDPNDIGVREAVQFLREIGLQGLAEVEYQVGADGVPRLMEIGAGPHGWIQLAIAAGVDLPFLAASVALGEPVSPVESYRVGVEMRWPAGEVLRAKAALARDGELPRGVGRGQIIAGLWPPWRPGMRYDGIDLGDLRPLIPAARWLRRFDRAV